tara:strand:- start:1560 stop:1967 length:408 start_codon:yes stop_codon:yes gene_type:complete
MHISGINKRKLTELLLEQAKQLSGHLDAPVGHIDTLYPLVWANFREEGGLRLTNFGRKLFVEHCHIEFTSITLKNPIKTLKQVLFLDKVLECPFFIKGTPTAKSHHIELFGDEVSTMLALYDGDLDLYLEANKPL